MSLVRTAISSLGKFIRPPKLWSPQQLNRSSSTKDSAFEVQHDDKNNKFFIEFKDQGDEAVIKYDEIRPKVLDFQYTGVPLSLQGKGVAKILAKGAFDYVVGKDYKMKISCSYLQKYLNENPKPEYSERVVSR